MLTTQDFGVLDEYFCGLVFFGEKINFFDKANGLRKMYEWKNNCENWDIDWANVKIFLET